MAAEIHVNDVGTSFRATIKDEDGNVVDVSTASVMKVWFERPDKTTVEFDAEFVTDGTDGEIEYLTQDGDLDQAGRWRVQGYVLFNSGVIHGNIFKFKVHANLREDPS